MCVLAKRFVLEEGDASKASQCLDLKILSDCDVCLLLAEVCWQEEAAHPFGSSAHLSLRA